MAFRSRAGSGLQLSITPDGGRDPIESWREWLTEHLHSVEVENYDPGVFFAECRISSLDDIAILQFKGGRQTFVRTEMLTKTHKSDHFIVSILNCDPDVFEQNGRSKKCKAGDIILLDTDRPYIVVHKSDADVLSFLIPRKRMEEALGSAGVAAGRILDGQNATTRIIRDFARSIAVNSGQMKDETARFLAQLLVEIVAAGFSEELSREQSFSHYQSLILLRAKSFIEDNMSNENLGLSAVSAFVGVSNRRLQEIFRKENSSVSEFMWHRRLIKAARILRDDSMQNTSISMIAYTVGFKSSAHFSRRFREYYGITPTSFRNNKSITEDTAVRKGRFGARN